MKISVLIIAQNEERYIERCLESIVNQTQKANEVILIVHNSTDHTLEIAHKFPITIIPFNGPKGIVFARLEGLKHVTGDIVLCTDGDSRVSKNWVEVMSETLCKNENILVGSRVRFKGTWYGWISNFFNRYSGALNKENVERWIWGPSFGFWGHDKNFVKDIWEKSIRLSEHLKLSRNPEDYWLALFMKKRGRLELTHRTWVEMNTKEVSNEQARNRQIENMRNGDKMEEYFKTQKLHS